MPLARVRVRLYGSPAQLTNARDLIVGQYPNAANIWDRNDGTATRIAAGLWCGTMDIRLRSAAAGDALRDAVVNLLPSIRGTGAVGRITYHQCTNDDADPQPCVVQGVTI